MTTRYRILRALDHFRSEWPNSWLAARDIRAFRRAPAEFETAMAALVEEGIVLRLGADDAGDRSYRLNPERRADFRREILAPLWPALPIMIAGLVAGLAAFAWTLRR